MNELNAEDKLCIEAIKAIPAKIKENILEYRFRDALFELMNLARTGNKYLADNELGKFRIQIQNVLKQKPSCFTGNCRCTCKLYAAIHSIFFGETFQNVES